MLTIRITKKVVGKIRLFEKRKQQGKSSFVSLYKATAIYNNEEYEFAVSRDSSARVFGKITHPMLYGENDECPPSKSSSPYQAILVTHSTGTPALLLSESYLPHHNVIYGHNNPFERKDIAIHIGPGMSIGCMMVAEGEGGLIRLMNFIKSYQKQGGTEIEVHVEDRWSTGGT